MQWKGTHFTYCLNIHPSETWEETFAAINIYARSVKKQICPNEPFGLGLRLSNLASRELEPQIGKFKSYLDREKMYIASINGFPYGRFSNDSVKKNVYFPDWSDMERVKYTKRLAHIYAALLPDGVTGSISTVPVCYGKKLPHTAVENLFNIANELAIIEEETNKKIILSLEPEPDCYLESSDDVLVFWNFFRSYKDKHICEYLGICLDTCHVVCSYEHPADFLISMKNSDIEVPKIQISNALRVLPDQDHYALLMPFIDKVHLHQTCVLSEGKILRFPDLDVALNKKPDGEWRVHFHVPIHFRGSNGLETTSFALDEFFFKELFIPGRHIEIETYSFNVLPGQRGDPVKSIIAEFQWIMNESQCFV